MRQLWPQNGSRNDLTTADLERLYGYPEELSKPWVQVNFVTSADGAVTVADKSEGLSHPADKRIFGIGRALCDVVLVGAGTVIAENYRGVRLGEQRVETRRKLGMAEIPPIAVVTARCSIEPDSALFTDAKVPPIVLTTEGAPKARREALAEAGAEVIIAGPLTVDLTAALEELGRRGLRRVNCEGGPHLFGALISENLVDQLCLTVAPLLAGAGAGRIAEGRETLVPRELALASILHEDGFTMFRYRRP
ncbi:pyrimidine reductase family protein [Amycolatopsis sp. YIM 10]|uniref:pyrimidine reductase family protein n=1 Tax=Amycolatopsis sp. YIM 10 TaxID=2653857 RepID=UPI00128FE58C|nr:pyrimidine reductase family protein [Amycolatopsis sp. YIM 10]QFU91333.1 2,5-diamino-6-ribosylamino-4(3H)-pyrimidinone 5'-phosphate reductase [Amycolatopsis sp. YIM 10]